jgi:phosphohistidine phosphatase SixA
MKRLEVRRHARRDPDADRLSRDGRGQAEDVGRTMTAAYDVVFVSPAERAAETVALFLRGSGLQLPEHEVIPGLAGKDATGGSPEGMAAGLRSLLERVPEGGRGLAVSHHPLIERGVVGLTGREIAPLAECEGVLLTLGDDGSLAIEELRPRKPGPDASASSTA